MTTQHTKLQLAYLNNLSYWTRGSKVLEEPFTFTWNNKIASFSPMIKYYPIVSWWPTINEDFAVLVFGGYMIESEKDGIKYYQLTESGIEIGRWKSHSPSSSSSRNFHGLTFHRL
jgi:hypothetical protein